MNTQMIRKNVSENDLEDDEGEEEDDDEEDRRLLIDSKLFTSNKQNHKCISCNKNFTTNNLMLQHFSAVHEKKRFPCGYCRETFAYRSGRTRHIHSVHQKLRFKCTLCKLTYTSRETAQMHVKTKHKIKEKIDLYLEKLSGNNNNDSTMTPTKSSPGVVQKRDQSTNHITKKSDIVPKLDPDKHFAHQNGVGSAEKTIKIESTSTPNNSNSASKERLKCYLCDKTFAYNAGRSKHIRIVHMNVRYRCMLCHSSYTTRDYAVQHVSSAHCIDSKHPVDYVERVQDDLPQVATTNSKPPEISNGGDQEDFEDEVSQDAMEDFEEDDDEMNGLQQFTSLLDHYKGADSTPQQRPPIVVGGNNLPFHCLQCGVGYETQELLMYHVNLEHEEQKIFCDYCGKSLLRPASLVGHMKEAHKDISYRCSMCGAVFSCPADGSYHIEDVHQCDPAEHLEHVPTCPDS